MPPKKRPRLSAKKKGKQKKAGGPDQSFPDGFFPLTAAAQTEKDAAAAAKKVRLQVAAAKAPPRKPGWQDHGFYTSQRVCISHLFRATLNWPAHEDWKSTRIAGEPNRWSLGAIRQCCGIVVQGQILAADEVHVKVNTLWVSPTESLSHLVLRRPQHWQGRLPHYLSEPKITS